MKILDVETEKVSSKRGEYQEIRLKVKIKNEGKDLEIDSESFLLNTTVEDYDYCFLENEPETIEGGDEATFWVTFYLYHGGVAKTLYYGPLSAEVPSY